MNDSTTTIYLEQVRQSLFGKRILVWDSFRSHISVKTKAKLKQLRVDTAVIPGGCTKFIQPPDVYWNSPFKASIRRQYEEWIVYGTKKVTKGGNPAPPQPEDYLNWIATAWEQLPNDLIARSFRGCGLTLAGDGSEDSEISCFKANGPIPEGLAALMSAREEFEANRLADNLDLVNLDEPEMDEEDENEEEEDIVVDFE